MPAATLPASELGQRTPRSQIESRPEYRLLCSNTAREDTERLAQRIRALGYRASIGDLTLHCIGALVGREAGESLAFVFCSPRAPHPTYVASMRRLLLSKSQAGDTFDVLQVTGDAALSGLGLDVEERQSFSSSEFEEQRTRLWPAPASVQDRPPESRPASPSCYPDHPASLTQPMLVGATFVGPSEHPVRWHMAATAATVWSLGAVLGWRLVAAF